MKPLLIVFFALCMSCGASSPPGEEHRTGAVDDSSAAASDATLYERLGGRQAIEAVVIDFVGRTTTDPRIKHRFFNTDPVHLRAMLVEQVCQATGGPCEYRGLDMKSAHAGMELVEEEFDALVEDLAAAMASFDVPERERNELLGALAGMKKDIIARKSDLRPIAKAGLKRAERAAREVSDSEAAELLQMAVLAGERGQRSYAEQLFSRAELRVGEEALAAVADVFREDAPPKVQAPLEKVPADAPPQPTGAVGNSDDERPRGERRAPSSLRGRITIDGAPLQGMGVVMLDPVSGRERHRTPKERVVEQRGRRFAPRLMAVPVGSTVSFPNHDPYFHNVFSLSSSAPFDLGLYAAGDSRSVTFDQEGIVRLGCNLHSNMAGYIIVVESQHYAVTKKAGSFHFRRLKPGTYKLKAWGESSSQPVETTVTIEKGENHFTVALKGGKPSANPNKFGADRN